MTNTSKPKAANLPELSAIPVPVDYSQPTGLALMLSDMIVSGRKVAAYLRQISVADFTSGNYSFPTPADYVPAPFRLPMLEPTTWNVVADVITAYQPVEVYQIGSTTDLVQTTFPIIINPTNYANAADAGDPIKPLAVGQSVVIRVYKVASSGINWAGSNIVNNGLTDEAIKSLTQITMVVTNVAGVYTVTDWLGVDFVTNGMNTLKTSAKGNFATVINELFDAIEAKTATGAAGGDLSGTYPNPTIGTGKVTADKIPDGGIPLSKLPSEARLANPNALTFTGGKTGTYDGSAANSVPVPYTWAQAVSKPPYTAAEVGAVPTAGGTINGAVTINGNLRINGQFTISNGSTSLQAGVDGNGYYMNLLNSSGGTIVQLRLFNDGHIKTYPTTAQIWAGGGFYQKGW